MNSSYSPQPERNRSIYIGNILLVSIYLYTAGFICDTLELRQISDL